MTIIISSIKIVSISSVKSVTLPDEIEREESTINLQGHCINEASLDEMQNDAARSFVEIASQENLRRYQPLNTNLGADTSQSSAPRPRNLSPVRKPKWKFEDPGATQRKICSIPDGTLRLLMLNDFPHSIHVKIVSHGIDERLEHVILLLHHFEGTEDFLESLAKRLHRRQPNSAYILLRGIEPVHPENYDYHRASL